jgi:3,4-dihydroxy 2-butanone 4-phosphate synthase/GTP cyclohydrolase II
MYDRAQTILALADPNTKPSDLGRPGHINPLRARSRGVLRRSGHTEAAVDLARLAGLYPAGALIEIINEDGTMSRLPELMEVAMKFDIKIICIKDLIAYRLKTESIVDKGEEVDMPTQFGHFRLIPFRQKSNGLEHIAIIKGEIKEGEPVLVRVHSSCATGDILGSMRCDCGPQLHHALLRIEEEGRGIVLYHQEEGRGIGLLNKLRAYALQDSGYDTLDANVALGFRPDERDYRVPAEMLKKIGVKSVRLMTNNPEKVAAMEACGLRVLERVQHELPPHEHNLDYLETKRERFGHLLQLDHA